MYARHDLQIGWACNESFLDNQQTVNGRLDGRGERKGGTNHDSTWFCWDWS